MDSQKLTAGLQPAQDCLHVSIALARMDGAVKSVFKQPIKQLWRLVGEKIGEMKMGFESKAGGLLLGNADGRRGQIETKSLKTSLAPGPRIMARAAAGNGNGATSQLPVFRQEIHQPRRRLSLFPRHIARLITRFPVSHTHKMVQSRIGVAT